MYVAISNDLITRVEEAITKMCNSEVRAAIPSESAAPKGDASALFNLGCWGKEHIHLLHVLPQDWLAEEGCPSIKVKGTTLDNNGNEINVSVEASFNGARSAFRRPSSDYWNRGVSEFSIDELRALPETYFGRDHLLLCYEQEETRQIIKARWSKIREDITSFLRKCKSLNEATKLFPAVKMYLDPNDVKRVETKVSRAPREELVKDIDTGAMTAAAIAARLSGVAA